jgi:hypothetical protein
MATARSSRPNPQRDSITFSPRQHRRYWCCSCLKFILVLLFLSFGVFAGETSIWTGRGDPSQDFTIKIVRQKKLRRADGCAGWPDPIKARARHPRSFAPRQNISSPVAPIGRGERYSALAAQRLAHYPLTRNMRLAQPDQWLNSRN